MLPPSLLYTGAAQTSCGAYQKDLAAAGTWSAEDRNLYISMLRDEGSPACRRRLQAQDHWRALGSHDQRCHGGGLPGEAGRDCV